MKCELCGTEVKVVGKTTMRYEPVVRFNQFLHSTKGYIFPSEWADVVEEYANLKAERAARRAAEFMTDYTNCSQDVYQPIVDKAVNHAISQEE